MGFAHAIRPPPLGARPIAARWGPRPVLLPFVFLLAVCCRADAGEQGAGFVASEVRGVPAYVVSNGVVRAVVASAAGGRLLGLSLAGRELLWSDPSAITATGETGPGGDSMYRYREPGGFRCWPGPQAHLKRADCPIQGWPPPPWIDRGPYIAGIGTDGTLDLHGSAERHPLWRSLGMQFFYHYRLVPDSGRLDVLVRMTNLATYPQRWCVWGLIHLPAPESAQVCWPFRSSAPSRFGPGNRMVQAGDYADPQWSADPEAGLVVARPLGRTGKISGDSDGGWIAWRDASDGSTVVAFFPVEPAQQIVHPEGGSTVAVNLQPGLQALEMELMSPEVTLDPGQPFDFPLQFAACRTAGPIRSLQRSGIVVAPLAVTPDGRIHGSFGVFDRGTCELLLSDDSGVRTVHSQEVSPLQPVLLDAQIDPTRKGVLELQLRRADGRQPIQISTCTIGQP